MLNEFINFETISRSDWQRFYQEDQVSLTPEELESIRSLNDKIDVQEVRDIYLPLINLIRIYHRAAEDLTFSKGIFLQKAGASITEAPAPPFTFSGPAGRTPPP